MSSATITPPEIFCCGPLGSLRYYMLQIVGVTGTCPQCTLNCDCSGINGTYFMDFLGPLSIDQCTTELGLPEICGYALLTFQIVPCSTSRVTYKIVLNGTATTTPATNFIWELSNIENAMEIQTVPFKSQLGGECSASSSYVIGGGDAGAIQGDAGARTLGPGRWGHLGLKQATPNRRFGEVFRFSRRAAANEAGESLELRRVWNSASRRVQQRGLRVSVQQHHLVYRSTIAIRQCLDSAFGVSSFFTSPLFAVGAVAAFILAVSSDVIRMIGRPDVGPEGMVVR